jgi:hypothetical protein
VTDPLAAVVGAGDRLASLGRGTPDERFRSAIMAADVSPAVRAGLWLYHDFWGEAHAVAQDLHTPEGSLWHAILHRREPDAWNSKYWWRKVGRHPALDALAAEAKATGLPFSTAEAFVDWCERVRGTGSRDEATAMQVQQLEWRLVFAHCRAVNLPC